MAKIELGARGTQFTGPSSGDAAHTVIVGTESERPEGTNGDLGNERERLADDRDRAAEHRERLADDRECLADRRERRADERESQVDKRTDRLDERERRLDAAVRSASGANPRNRQRRAEQVQRSRATLEAASAQLDRVEEQLLRDDARETREQQAIDRETAATERLAAQGAGRLPEPDPEERLARLRARFLAAGADLARTADEVTAHYDRLLQEQPDNDMYRRRVQKAREAARSAHDAVRRLGGGEHRTP